MPKMQLAIHTDKFPTMYATREVKTLADLRKLLKDADTVIAKAVKVFPSLGDCAVMDVKYRDDKPKTRVAANSTEQTHAATA
jgi:hypothetical protein